MIFMVSIIKEEVRGEESEFRSIVDAVLLPMKFWEMFPTMKNTAFRILITLLILLFACVSSQVTLTESGGGIKRPGDTLQLTCTVSFDLTSNRVSWVRQPPGKGLEWMGVSSQFTLTESGGGIKRPGDTLQLTCTVSFDLTSNAVSWIRQPPGKGLEWIGDIWSYNNALQSRISITRDTDRKKVSLQLRSLKPEDTSMYYCVRGTETQVLLDAGKKLSWLKGEILYG
ncbi:UNVERIFIED_CONTAM: hypothetical protein K2H54_044322 [Gekko kuhli]